MCMIEGANGQVVVLSEHTPVAKQEHKCSECHRTIEPGERYLLERYVFDRQARTHKTCAHCQVVRDWLTAECGGFLYEGITEDILEHFREGYGFGVGRLALGISSHWRRKDQSLFPLPKMPRLSSSREASK